MTCPVCGKPQPCAHSRSNTAVALRREEADETALAASSPYDQVYWRQEIASRVQQHRARRRRRSGGEASLELNFPPFEGGEENQAQAPLPPAAPQLPNALTTAAAPEPRKIIRFPRMASPEPLPADLAFVDELELAVPAPETPRILDAPEARQMPLLSGLADIPLAEPEPDYELAPPPQPAPLYQRALAGLVDGAVVAAGAAVFALAFAEMSAARLQFQGRAALSGAAAFCGILWLLFQYIFMVYGRQTPGMRAAGLEVCDFDGERATLAARRRRAFATMLSALSLGLGLVWAFVDEDTLGWHDRISGTYVRKSNQQPAVSTQLRD